MELFRVNRNAWGQEILVGISWDLIWLFVGAGLLGIAAHFLYLRFGTPKSETRRPVTGDAMPVRVIRHGRADRAYHWVMAISVLTLLGTSFLPILGIKFAWVTIHWVSGVVLSLAVLVHMTRAVIWQDRLAMVIGPTDLLGAWRAIGRALGRGGPERDKLGKPGKYPFLQKIYHLGAAAIVLTEVITGLLMMVKIDTPLWRRNPYIFSDHIWGIIYVLHGLAALSLIALIMMHIYFALRPEKLFMTRSMILGWITRAEYEDHFDSEKWALEEDAPKQIEP